MAKADVRDVLQRILDCAPAMAVLDTWPVEEPRPPKTHPYEQGNPLRGTLVMRDDGTAEDPGAPGKSLGDLLREAAGAGRG